MASAETPEREKHARYSKQTGKKQVKILNSGYHGGVRFRVIETGTANIHNHEKRVLIEKAVALFGFSLTSFGHGEYRIHGIYFKLLL